MCHHLIYLEQQITHNHTLGQAEYPLFLQYISSLIQDGNPQQEITVVMVILNKEDTKAWRMHGPATHGLFLAAAALSRGM